MTERLAVHDTPFYVAITVQTVAAGAASTHGRTVWWDADKRKQVHDASGVKRKTTFVD